MPGSRGNRNALKHGFYASLWTREELVGLKKAGEVNDVNGEINLLRVVIRRIAKTIPQIIEQEKIEVCLHTVSTLSLAVQCLSTVVRTNLIGGNELPLTEVAILDALTRFREETGI